MDQVCIGKFIAELRKENELTQEELASMLGVNVKSISRWENGKNMPDLSLLIPISEIFKVSVTEILNGRRMNKEELIELKGTIEKLIEYNKNVIIDKSKIWQFNLRVGWCLLVLTILSNYVPFLEVIFTENAAEFVRGLLYGIGIAYELVCVYNVSHELTLKEKKRELASKGKK